MGGVGVGGVGGGGVGSGGGSKGGGWGGGGYGAALILEWAASEQIEQIRRNWLEQRVNRWFGRVAATRDRADDQTLWER